MADLKQGVQYYSSGDFFEYIEDVPSMPDFAVVREGGDGYITVARKSDLKPYEESWQWQRKEAAKERLEKVTAKAQANLDKLTEKLVDKALISLASRIKFNVAFGEGGVHNAYALMLSTELEKMIRKEAPKVIEKGEV